MRQLMCTFGMVAFVMGCDVHLHPYTDYLNQSVGRADHDAIAKKMGAPKREVALDTGGDVWIYEYCPPGTTETASPTCQYLNLVFDKLASLLNGTTRKYFYCTPFNWTLPTSRAHGHITDSCFPILMRRRNGHEEERVQQPVDYPLVGLCGLAGEQVLTINSKCR